MFLPCCLVCSLLQAVIRRVTTCFHQVGTDGQNLLATWSKKKKINTTRRHTPDDALRMMMLKHVSKVMMNIFLYQFSIKKTLFWQQIKGLEFISTFNFNFCGTSGVAQSTVWYIFCPKSEEEEEKKKRKWGGSICGGARSQNAESSTNIYGPASRTSFQTLFLCEPKLFGLSCSRIRKFRQTYWRYEYAL